MLLTCVLVIKTTRQAAVSAAWIRIVLPRPPRPPLSLRPAQAFQPGAFFCFFFQSTASFQRGEKKKNDLLWWSGAAGILQMLIWGNGRTSVGAGVGSVQLEGVWG